MSGEQRQSLRVSRAIKLALARIAERNPELAQFAQESIKTGTNLSYIATAPKPVPRRKRASEGEKTLASSRKNPVRR